MTDAPPPDEANFGPNLWLVDQMYRRYQDDASHVSTSWREFFATYRPTDLTGEPLSHADPSPDGNGKTLSAASPPPLTSTPDRGVPAAAPAPREGPAGSGEEVKVLRGASATIAERMDASKDLPTATSVRTMPAKLLEVNRRILNNQLARLDQGTKVSFTHLIGWATVKALQTRPAMNAAYRLVDGQPNVVRFDNINLGLAVDMAKKDGTRTLLVPNIKQVDEMDFSTYWAAYEELIGRVRAQKITPDDFTHTTVTLTNPGTVGTIQSVPRLMPDQGLIVGVGAITYPPEYEAADPAVLAQNGVGRVLTMTSTYDHRIIQGAESGLLLQKIHQLLLGEDEFYDEIFRSMKIPYVPARWARDRNPPPGSRPWAEKQARVFQLINNYRVRGHLIADLDPLRQDLPDIHAELDPLTYGLTIWDLNRDFATGGLAGHTVLDLGTILGVLRDAYGRTIGIEYMHIQEPDQQAWIQDHVEKPRRPLEESEKHHIYSKLYQAEAFERFLHTKFLGAKRFSLEGAESFIPLLDAVLNEAADAGMSSVGMGMAHRGRLNVLANVIGKGLDQMFLEFAGIEDNRSTGFSGDVKYHLGAAGTHHSPLGNSITIYVAANPSHLEAVNPVLEGIVRAQQDDLGAGADDMVLPVLIHGDAAFSGQGVVAETLNLSQLDGYYTGGTVHIVINNQVGFTTSAAEARSSFYATDIAKAVQAPIFHVNGDDPEAVIRVARLAFQFRQAFHKDVVIDLICYRRLGHNEGDEPSFTQPKMYNLIKSHGTVRDIYMERLLNRGEVSPEQIDEIEQRYQAKLDAGFVASKQGRPELHGAGYNAQAPEPSTKVDAETLKEIGAKLTALPEGFTVHPKLEKTLSDRANLFESGQVDWALAEALAMGSLALEGHRIRLAGEDSQRGTFSHRHAVLVDYNTEADWSPLQQLSDDQAPINIIDSLLSEFAAMGFEYGYSVQSPESLVMWEAQFGDFVNGAQVIIDQFLMSGGDKWEQASSLTLLLPHGFEGQGPEHSSARVERFLNNAAEDNVRVAIPSTPAQYFHLLRRQVHHQHHHPLIILTPKSLLRTRTSFSELADLSDRELGLALPDPRVGPGARRVVMCAGKIYYDLLAKQPDDVAIVRVEQLYPLPNDTLKAILDSYGDAELVWVQEEPGNMGGWRYMSRALFVEIGKSSRGIYRAPSASPATGNFSTHTKEQNEIVALAFE